MENYKKVLLILGIIFLIILGIIFFSDINKKSSTSQPSSSSNVSGATQQVKVVPLSQEQRQKVENALLSSEFIQDIPENNPISLRFFYFEEEQRVWQDIFYMGRGGLIDPGEMGISLSLHSKYIEELDKNDLCSIIQTANQNRDLGFDSDYSQTQLLWKYKGMIKYRDCFGF
ncbi:MAG TPA: hypothetical protein VJA20_04405 [Candidatus Nanoarchaeia archaeon]|nr:hypothetical protein [Candidatus Nanoarchaeia archaeon]